MPELTEDLVENFRHKMPVKKDSFNVAPSCVAPYVQTTNPGLRPKRRY